MEGELEMATYVCSDIHGQFDAWLLALKKSGIQLKNGDELVILGDLIDRGQENLACLNFALELLERYPAQVTYLMGNHEKMFLDFVNVPMPKTDIGYINIQINGQRWMGNGGIFTIKSLLGELPESIYKTYELLNEKHSALIKKLNKLPYYKIDYKHNCIYVHAGFESNIPLHEQNKSNMLWIREEFFEHFQPVKGDVLENKLIVHGHTPVQYIPNHKGNGFYKGKHHICIDGGSARKENIIILKMDDLSFISQKVG